MKTNQYCIACGSDKGHNFSGCKNVSAMRKIILDQDSETQSALDRALRAEEQLSEAARWEDTAHFQMRVIEALLDGAEATRQKKRIKP